MTDEERTPLVEARFYSDRESTADREPVHPALTERAWRGLVALVEEYVAGNAWAESFPLRCSDEDSGRAVIGTDEYALQNAWMGLVPNVDLPLAAHEPQDTVSMLDSLEFLHDRVRQPRVQTTHSFFDHPHLRFPEDQRAAAQRQFRSRVNEILARQRVRLLLDDTGRFRRLNDAVFDAMLDRIAPDRTGNEEADRLLQTAARKFVSPDPNVRREALETLWDAYERVKTLQDGKDKRSRATAMIEAAATASEIREMLTTEAKELSAIGNRFRIRHAETDQIPLETEAQVDALFFRLWAFLDLVAPTQLEA